MSTSLRMSRLLQPLLQLGSPCVAPCQHSSRSTAWATTLRRFAQTPESRAACMGVMQLLAGASGTPQGHAPAAAQVDSTAGKSTGCSSLHPHHSHAAHGPCMRSQNLLSTAMHHQQLPVSAQHAAVRHMATRQSEGRDEDGPDMHGSSAEPAFGEALYWHVRNARLRGGGLDALKSAISVAEKAAANRSKKPPAPLWPWVRQGEQAVLAAKALVDATRHKAHKQQSHVYSMYVAACLPYVDNMQLLAMLQVARDERFKVEVVLQVGPVRTRVAQHLLTQAQELTNSMQTGTGAGSKSAAAAGSVTQLQPLGTKQMYVRMVSACELLDALAVRGAGAQVLVRLADMVTDLEAKAAERARQLADQALKTRKSHPSEQPPHLRICVDLLDELVERRKPHLPLAAAVLSRVLGVSGMAGCLEVAGFVVPEAVVGELDSVLASSITAEGDEGGSPWHAYAPAAVAGAACGLELACTHLRLQQTQTGEQAADDDEPAAYQFDSKLLLQGAEQLLRLQQYAQRISRSSGSRAEHPQGVPVLMKREDVARHVRIAVAHAKVLAGSVQLSRHPLLQRFLAVQDHTAGEA